MFGKPPMKPMAAPPKQGTPKQPVKAFAGADRQRAQAKALRAKKPKAPALMDEEQY